MITFGIIFGCYGRANRFHNTATVEGLAESRGISSSEPSGGVPPSICRCHEGQQP